MKFPFVKPRENPPEETADRSLLFRNTDPRFNEQFKNFSARFEYRVDMMNFKVIAITSSIAGEGKTVSTVNLATDLASTGRKRVLLVDVDLRKSDLAKGLRVLPRPGLAEYLGGSTNLQDILRNSLVPGLYVIPGGMRINAPWSLIAGERFRAFLKENRDRYDLILLDTPPIIPVSDTLAIRDAVDGFVLVYRLGFTPHAMFRQTLEEIGEKKLLGVLLNGVEQPSEKYYQRYYGKYYTKPEER